MIDREKVIDYLKWAIAEAELTGHTSITLEPLKDALTLLKEQEPRVMTFEEIKDNMGVPVWVEYADNENWNGYGVPTSDHKAYIMIYGANAYCANYAHTHNVAWRAWSARPTEEQRKAVKWDA